MQIQKENFVDDSDVINIVFEVFALNNLGKEEALPNWLTFDNSTNILSGIPDLIGNYPLILKFNDSNNN